MSEQKTEFAPAERADPEDLQRQINLFQSSDEDLQIGNAMPLVLLVLNAHRQIIYANKRMQELLNLDDLSCVYGQRPGEILNCVHATESPGGCGTTEYCHNCGAVQAILEAQHGSQTVKECRLTDKTGLSADFRIMATPVERDGEPFTFFTAEDIQHEKRRQALERTFFHDILNTAGGVSGLVEMMEFIESQTEREEIFNILKTSSRRLIDEIHSGRVLSQAESGSLDVMLTPTDIRKVISDTVDLYRNHDLCTERSIQYQQLEQPLMALTDEFILQRVVGNLIKNALEATEKGQTVAVRLTDSSDAIELSVNNPTVMPLAVKQQVFQRSFSTKGKGRGIGTYSIKLFTENYLDGKVWFESEEPDGTTFHVALPREK